MEPDTSYASVLGPRLDIKEMMVRADRTWEELGKQANIVQLFQSFLLRFGHPEEDHDQGQDIEGSG